MDCVFSRLPDIGDVEEHMPGFMKETVDWFRCYKIPDGKPENNFAFNGTAKGKVNVTALPPSCHSNSISILTDSLATPP